MTEPSQTTPTPWTTKVDRVASARYFAPLAELTMQQIEAVVAEALKETEAALPMLLEPYDTKVDAETLARVVG